MTQILTDEDYLISLFDFILLSNSFYSSTSMLSSVSYLTSNFQGISHSWCEDFAGWKFSWPWWSKFVLTMDFLGISTQLLGYLWGTNLIILSRWWKQKYFIMPYSGIKSGAMKPMFLQCRRMDYPEGNIQERWCNVPVQSAVTGESI